MPVAVPQGSYPCAGWATLQTRSSATAGALQTSGINENQRSVHIKQQSGKVVLRPQKALLISGFSHCYDSSTTLNN